MKTEEIFISIPKSDLLDENDEEALSEHWNYWALAIYDETQYYFWAKGVSLKISSSDLIEVIKYPFLTTDSMAFKLHQQIEVIKNLSNVGLTKSTGS